MRGTPRAAALVAAGTLAVAVAAAAAAPLQIGPVTNGSPRASAWHVVALGDSGASGRGDPTRQAWSGRYARLLTLGLHHKVLLTNLASEGLTSSQLLRNLRTDPNVRGVVANADILLFGSTAGSHLNAADGMLAAGACKGTACYASQLRLWAKDFEQIVAASVKLRDSKKTVLLGVTDPNVVPGAQGVVPPFATVALGLFQARTIKRTVCATVSRDGGKCVDVLAAFNGPSGTEDAYKKGLMNKIECCYASGKGQQLIAELLYRAGLNQVTTLP